MINVILVGAGGKMGQAIIALMKESDGFTLFWAKDKIANLPKKSEFSNEMKMNADFPKHIMPDSIVIDFSSPQGTIEAVNFARRFNLPFISGTTGLDEKGLESLKSASSQIPVFYATNMSLGIAVLSRLVKESAGMLKDKADVEIIEYHHRRKLDSPSGTALSLAEIVKEGFGDAFYLFGRQGKTGPRKKNEIGIHSIRAGRIVGRHDVIFALPEEVVVLSHIALTRNVFARGVLEAAKFVITKEAGYYTMSDLLEERIQ